MVSNRQLFLKHVAQTSDSPLILEIDRAEGIYLYDNDGKQYIDLISGVSVNNVGHRHPKVVHAIKEQLDKYMHLMVYGEYIQVPQIQLASLLHEHLPEKLNCTYFVNSGSEAVEGAIKLAKRFTGRFEIIACKNAYHGGTHGALSVLGNEYFKNSFRPLTPGVRFIRFNQTEDLDRITGRTACVIAEPIQGEAGIRLPENDFLKKLRTRCKETGTLLIFDEIQTGFGRTGNLFAFQEYNSEPDILVLAKSLGGGLPLGAFIADREVMSVFKKDPVLGHLSTFGGHPVSCASGLASFRVLLDEGLVNSVPDKEKIFRKQLSHPAVKTIRGKGLFLAVELEDPLQISRVITNAKKKGIVLDSFLFCDTAFRISPPLIITEEEIIYACEILNQAIDESVK